MKHLCHYLMLLFLVSCSLSKRNKGSTYLSKIRVYPYTLVIYINLSNYLEAINNSLSLIAVSMHDIQGLYQTRKEEDYYIVEFISSDSQYSLRIVFQYDNLYMNGFLSGNDTYYYFKSYSIKAILEQQTSKCLGYAGSYSDLGGIPSSLSLEQLDNDIITLHNYDGKKDIKQNLGRIIVTIAEATRFKGLHRNIGLKFKEWQKYILTDADIYDIHHWSYYSDKVFNDKDLISIQKLSLTKSHNKNILNYKAITPKDIKKSKFEPSKRDKK